LLFDIFRIKLKVSEPDPKQRFQSLAIQISYSWVYTKLLVSSRIISCF